MDVQIKQLRHKMKRNPPPMSLSNKLSKGYSRYQGLLINISVNIEEIKAKLSIKAQMTKLGFVLWVL